MRYRTVHPAIVLACLFMDDSLYCWPGQSVSSCVIVKVRPTTADLNCAIVPLPFGSCSDPTVMAGSRLSTVQGATVLSLLMVKLGFATTLLGFAHAASICGCVASWPARRSSVSRLAGVGRLDVIDDGDAEEATEIPADIMVSVRVEIWIRILVCTDVTVIMMGVVGHISSVVALLTNLVGVGSGIEELPVGKGGTRVELNGALGVADGKVLALESIP